MADGKAAGAARALAVAVIMCGVAAGLACRSGEEVTVEEAAVPAPRLPARVVDGLELGMTRAQVAKTHPIRPSLPVGGRDLRLWVYHRPGKHIGHLTFSGTAPTSRLIRIDLRFGGRGVPAEQMIARYGRLFGTPDVRRRPAEIGPLPPGVHEQFDTIWSDDSRYVYLTETVPKAGKSKRTAYVLTVKEKEIKAAGPPTGYVPPPPPEGEESSGGDPFF